jgi:hypothetical protein
MAYGGEVESYWVHTMYITYTTAVHMRHQGLSALRDVRRSSYNILVTSFCTARGADC